MNYPQGHMSTPESSMESMEAADFESGHITPGSTGEQGMRTEDPDYPAELTFDLKPGEAIQISIGPVSGEQQSHSHRVRVSVSKTETSVGWAHNHQQVLHKPVIERELFPQAYLLAKLKTRLKTVVSSWPYSLETTLFGLGLMVYLASRLIGLADFPIYFFTDEAVQTVTAADLIRDHFTDSEGVFLPTFFKNGPYYNLSISVYLQVIPYIFFGKSVFITRGVSVLVGLLAPISLALVLRDILQVPYWWVGTLLLSSAPAWFLHSRTAFETALFVAFYAGFLYFYLRYRQGEIRQLYNAIGLGALAFYSYSPGQMIIGLTGLLLLISDARYHWQNRAVLIRSVGLIILLAVFYLRFRLDNPSAPYEHLRILGSYWVQPLDLSEKLSRFFSEYLYGLSPGYWFIPNERDLMRHLMKGYGHLLRPTLPFFILGGVLAIKNIKNPAYRTILIALLVSPAGSALVQIGITRVLVFVIPAVILITLGLVQCLLWVERLKLPRSLLSSGMFFLLASVNLWMLRDALTKGPIWYQDYGLGGMQYGARQLFPLVKKILEESPNTRVIISPTWANGTDVVARFFLPDDLPYQMGSIDGHLNQYHPLDENTLFVMPADEYQKTIESGKFKEIQVERTLAYPNGQPGFYFVRLQYVDNIQDLLAQERMQRMILRQDIVTIDGESVPIKYSMLDIGVPEHMFDGDPNTLSRTFEANPAIVELDFLHPKTITGLSMIIGSTEVEIKAWLYEERGAQPIEYSGRFRGTLDQPEISLDFGEPVTARIVRLEVRDIHQGEPANVHIWEIKFH